MLHHKIQILTDTKTTQLGKEKCVKLKGDIMNDVLGQDAAL